MSLLGVASASAFDLNPFQQNAPQQMAQSDAPPGSIPGADSGDAGALDVRIDRLENELRQANGRIEELENQQHRLEELVKRFQQDVEFRLGGSGGAAGGVPAQAAVASPPAPAAVAAAPSAGLLAPQDAPAARPSRRGDAFDPSANPDAVGAPRPLGSTPPSAPLELAGARPEPPPAPVAPAAVSPPAGALPGEGATVAGAGVGFTDGPREQYNTAIEAYRNGQYGQAEEQLRSFLAANSGNRLAPDAIFYLGETYFQRSRPREAAEQYLKLSTDYAKSARAPEGMLRLGQSLALLGSSEQACATFAEVSRRYPTASPAVKKLAEREMQKSHC